MVIAFSQLRLRHKLEAAGAEIPFKMWLFPWLTWFVIIIILSVLAYMFFSPAYSYETTLSLGVTLGVVVCGLFVTRKRKATRSVAINQSNL
ncbi:amino acid permease family protein [Acinetobacter baumannii 25977_9]|nr:amino acid permease family protein [Acinetobacter baumannii 25977_9]